jgi:hypothetical protein
VNVDSTYKIAYAAHTNSCTFLLDSEGVCRRIVPQPALTRTAKGREAAAAANRCVGAQYVASLDGSVPGLLAEMPRAGIPMVFARVDSRGRVSLVRTGVVTRFDSQRRSEPFSDPAPSVSVETSAPPIPPAKHGARERFRPARVIADTLDDDPTLDRNDSVVPRAAASPRRSDAHAHRPRERTSRTTSAVSEAHGARREPLRTPRTGALPGVPDVHLGRRSTGR